MPKTEYIAQDKLDFINELERFNDNPEKIFHYTNLDSLLSILSKQELWLTQYKYLNDTSEIEYAENILLNEVKKIKDTNIRVTIEEIISTMKNRLENTFILSFSKNHDSLPLWSYYSSLDGFNIGFDNYHLDNIYNTGFTSSKKADSNGDFKRLFYNDVFIEIKGNVIYEENKQIEIAKKAIKYLVTSLGNENIENTNKINIPEDMIDLINLTNIISKCFLLFKNNVFNSEKEYRFAFVLKDPALKKDILNFRTNNGTLVPFIKIKIKPDFIDSITIGPTNKTNLKESAISEFMEFEDYNMDDIELLKSVIPLRF